MFASKSVLEHVLRGVLGLAALAAAVLLAPHRPWLALAALPVALFALRGCPSCWVLGLIETVSRASSKAVPDARCSKPDAFSRVRW